MDRDAFNQRVTFDQFPALMVDIAMVIFIICIALQI